MAPPCNTYTTCMDSFVGNEKDPQRLPWGRGRSIRGPGKAHGGAWRDSLSFGVAPEAVSGNIRKLPGANGRRIAD